MNKGKRNIYAWCMKQPVLFDPINGPRTMWMLLCFSEPDNVPQAVCGTLKLFPPKINFHNYSDIT